MQVEPETVYCEEGTALQDELDLDHLEDGMHADGTWLYYGKPDEGFFFLLWFEDEGEAMTTGPALGRPGGVLLAGGSGEGHHHCGINRAAPKPLETGWQIRPCRKHRAAFGTTQKRRP